MVDLFDTNTREEHQSLEDDSVRTERHTHNLRTRGNTGRLTANDRPPSLYSPT